MNTQVLPVTEESVRLAAQLLRQGELVALPTETVYGLAADARNGEAVKKIFEAKGRPQDNPLIVHIGGLEMLRGPRGFVRPSGVCTASQSCLPHLAGRAQVLPAPALLRDFCA